VIFIISIPGRGFRSPIVSVVWTVDTVDRRSIIRSDRSDTSQLTGIHGIAAELICIEVASSQSIEIPV